MSSLPLFAPNPDCRSRRPATVWSYYPAPEAGDQSRVAGTCREKSTVVIRFFISRRLQPSQSGSIWDHACRAGSALCLFVSDSHPTTRGRLCRNPGCDDMAVTPSGVPGFPPRKRSGEVGCTLVCQISRCHALLGQGRWLTWKLECVVVLMNVFVGTWVPGGSTSHPRPQHPGLPSQLPVFLAAQNAGRVGSARHLFCRPSDRRC